MKIFVHWDMEGTSGVFTREQVWYWEDGARPEIGEEGRQLLTEDINSLSAAVLRAGVDQLIVCDTHHGGGNLDLQKALADPRITYLPRSVGYQGTERRWMPGLDETVDALMLPGHHARAGTPNAFLPHTWTLAWADFQINGQSVGEMGIEACFAGHWDVPPILAQGDEAGCREAEALFPGIVTAAVKRAESADLCSGLAAAAGRRLTAEKVVEAIDKLRAGAIEPYKPSLPMTVSIRMKTAESVQAALQRPGVERVDGLTVACQVKQQCDVVKWILGTGLDMAPPRP